MNTNIANDRNQPQQQQEQSSRGEASEHGHTGEGAASALAHMISQGEKHRWQGRDAEDSTANR